MHWKLCSQEELLSVQESKPWTKVLISLHQLTICFIQQQYISIKNKLKQQTCVRQVLQIFSYLFYVQKLPYKQSRHFDFCFDDRVIRAYFITHVQQKSFSPPLQLFWAIPHRLREPQEMVSGRFITRWPASYNDAWSPAECGSWSHETTTQKTESIMGTSSSSTSTGELDSDQLGDRKGKTEATATTSNYQSVPVHRVAFIQDCLAHRTTTSNNNQLIIKIMLQFRPCTTRVFGHLSGTGTGVGVLNKPVKC